MMNEFDFVKTIFGWGQDIKVYVAGGWINASQYKEITGNDYVA